MESAFLGFSKGFAVAFSKWPSAEGAKEKEKQDAKTSIN